MLNSEWSSWAQRSANRADVEGIVMAAFDTLKMWENHSLWNDFFHGRTGK